MSDAKPNGGQSPYIPLPAGHIRVLVLAAGSSDSPLQAHLEARPLNTNGVTGEHGDDADNRDGFEAISYCWGAETSQQKLHMNDGSELALTQSLYSALHAFRYVDRPRTLWADAVCINQDDVSERSSQVAMMGTIYATARRVLVWLGPCLGESETIAFITLTAPIIAKGDRSRRDLLHIIEKHLQSATECKCCHSALSPSRPMTLEDGLSAVAKLLERPWLGRLWVVQEVALASEIIVHCGSHFVPWEIFTEVARVPGQYEGDQQQEEQLVAPAMPRGDLRQIWAHCNYLNQLRSRNRHILNDKESYRPTALCKDLLMLSRLGCQDLHDRIYGVSRVLGLHAFEFLRADYTISVSELYRRVVELSLTAPANRPGGRAVLMLALAGTELLPEAATLARPSWVPHLQYLSERSRSKHTYYQWAFNERQFYADAAEFRCKVSQEDPQMLLVRGTCFGHVTTVLDQSACPSKQIHRRTPSKCPDQEAVALIRWYRRCCEFIEGELLKPHSRSSPTAVGRLSDRKAYEIFASSHEDIKPSERRLLPAELVDKWLGQARVEANDIGGRSELAYSLSPYVTGYPYDRERNLCVLNTNYGYHAAWVPPAAKPGDEICYFGGAPYPFLVRRSYDGTFKLIGDVLVLELGESEMLDINPREWSTILEKVKQAQANLKSWMESQRRSELKTAEAASQLRNEDQCRKDEVESALSKLKLLYREADQRHKWIRLC